MYTYRYKIELLGLFSISSSWHKHFLVCHQELKHHSESHSRKDGHGTRGERGRGKRGERCLLP